MSLFRIGIILWLVLLVSVLPLHAQEAPSRFGVVEGFWLPEVVCELGAGWERIIFDWAQHQPTGPDDWHTLNVDDRWLAAARDCNREVVAIIKHTPAWASEGLPGAGLPKGLYLAVDDPGNTWARFLRRAAEYYAPRGVSRFILWNEPDITRDTYGFEFDGSLEDYARLLKVGALALRQGNPDAEVLLAGMTYWHDVNAGRRLYLDRLLEHLQMDPEAAANGYYFDIVPLHIYFRSDTVYDIVRLTRELLDRYGLTDKRIWINEMNSAPTHDPLWPVVRPQYQVDLGQQAAFLVQAAALGLAAGAERLAVFKFYDWSLPPGGEAFGLLRADQSRRPAFDAWASVIQRLSDVATARLARSERLNAVWMTHTDGRQTLALWARTGDAARVRLTGEGEDARQTDMFGVETALATADGLVIDLAPARCDERDGCAVGGPPLLIELGDGPFSAFEVLRAVENELQFE